MSRGFDPASDFSRLADSRTGTALTSKDLKSAAIASLIDSRLIERAPDTTHYACPACRASHQIERQGEAFVVVCESGVSTLKQEQVRRWRVNWNKLQSIVKGELAINGPIRDLVPETACFLGMLGKPQVAFPVWLVRGLSDPAVRLRVLKRFETNGPHQAGVILSASRQLTPPAFSNGSKCLWLGDLVRLDGDRLDFNLTAVWGLAPGPLPGMIGKRGRPEKLGDPLDTFLDRINAGTALRTISAEAKDIHKIEIKLHGRDKAYAKTSIENLIRDVFNAWKAAGFPKDFQSPEKSE